MSAVPLRILEFSSHESNSVQSLQFSNRLFSRRLCIFHFPTKKSKSLGDDVDDAVIFRSPLVSKLNFGIGRLGSVVRTVCCACAWSMPVPLAPMLQMATARIVIKYFISQFSDVIVRSSTVEQWPCGSHLTYSTAERSAFQFRLPLNTLRKEQGAKSKEQRARSKEQGAKSRGQRSVASPRPVRPSADTATSSVGANPFLPSG